MEPVLKKFYQLTPKAQLGTIACLSMLLLIGFQWLLEDRTAGQRHLHQYGGMVAEQLTRLSKDAMLREDTIALNVLAEQVASDSTIASVTIYSMDGRTLASYGTAAAEGSAAHEFNRPIQLADATAGFVRVTLDPNALTAPTAASPALSWFTRMWRPLTSLLLAAVSLWAAIFWLTRDSGRAQVVRPRPGLENDQPIIQPILLLTIKLFNGTEMSSARRDALMDAAESRVTGVTQLYGAQLLSVEPGALAVVFAIDTTDDQRFQAACAALAIARLCNQPGGARYRYSLREAQLTAPNGSDIAPSAIAELLTHSESILADSLLYAALASDNTIAVSADYARALARPERLNLTREHSPMLASLQTEVATDYYLLSGASAATESMLKHQVEALER